MSEHQVMDEIIEALKKIPAEERQQWLNRVMLFLAYATPPSEQAGDASAARKPKRRMIELRGLGKEVWRGVDAQDYVNSERDSWRG